MNFLQATDTAVFRRFDTLTNFEQYTHFVIGIRPLFECLIEEEEVGNVFKEMAEIFDLNDYPIVYEYYFDPKTIRANEDGTYVLPDFIMEDPVAQDYDFNLKERLLVGTGIRLVKLAAHFAAGMIREIGKLPDDLPWKKPHLTHVRDEVLRLRSSHPWLRDQSKFYKDRPVILDDLKAVHAHFDKFADYVFDLRLLVHSELDAMELDVRARKDRSQKAKVNAALPMKMPPENIMLHSRHGSDISECNCIICNNEFIDLSPKRILSIVRKIRRALFRLKQSLIQAESAVIEDGIWKLPAPVVDAINNINGVADLGAWFAVWEIDEAKRIPGQIPHCSEIVYCFTTSVDNLMVDFNSSVNLLDGKEDIIEWCDIIDGDFHKEINGSEQMRQAALEWTDDDESLMVPSRAIGELLQAPAKMCFCEECANKLPDPDMKLSEWIEIQDEAGLFAHKQSALHAPAFDIGSDGKAIKGPEQPKLTNGNQALSTQSDWFDNLKIKDLQILMTEPDGTIPDETTARSRAKSDDAYLHFARSERGVYRADRSHPTVKANWPKLEKYWTDQQAKRIKTSNQS